MNDGKEDKDQGDLELQLYASPPCNVETNTILGLPEGQGALLCPNHRRALVGKATFRNLAAAQHTQDHKFSTGGRMTKSSEESKGKIRNYTANHVANNSTNFEFLEILEGASDDCPEVLPGAIRVQGPLARFDEDFDTITTSVDDINCNIEARANPEESLHQVEAHAVPETQEEIDNIVHQRVDLEVKAKLQQVTEAKIIESEDAGSETGGSGQKKAKNHVIRKKIIGLISIIAAAAATGTAIATQHLKSVAAKVPFRVRFVENALGSEFQRSSTWKVYGTPQYNAFGWLTTNDTIDVQTLNPEQTLERYALAVLYFSATRPPTPFLQPAVSVCEWNHEQVVCANGTSVTEIRFGEFALAAKVIASLLGSVKIHLK